MIDKKYIAQYIFIALSIIGGAICLVTSNTISAQSAANSEETVRAYDKSDEDISPLTISGLSATDLPETIHTTILDQIYAKHYERKGTVERSAELTDATKKSNDTYILHLKFVPSNTSYRVTIVVKNAITNLYDFAMEEV